MAAQANGLRNRSRLPARDGRQRDVWFDDMGVVVQGSMIVQENHYDPWGMNLVGIEKQDIPTFRYQYNAMQEKQGDALGKGYFYETDYRAYDPQLGRFRGIDILVDAMPGISPYHYAYTNPVMFNDPSGAFADPVIQLAEIVVRSTRLFTFAQLGFQAAALHVGTSLVVVAGINAAGSIASMSGGCCGGDAAKRKPQNDCRCQSRLFPLPSQFAGN